MSLRELLTSPLVGLSRAEAARALPSLQHGLPAVVEGFKGHQRAVLELQPGGTLRCTALSGPYSEYTVNSGGS